MLKNNIKCLPLDQSGFTDAGFSVIVQSMTGIPDNSEDVEPVSTDIDLVALLKRIETKDRNAFDQFYDSTVKTMYSYAIRMTRQHEIAEEVVSDVYMRVWQKASNYDLSRGNVIAWLTIMCRSKALDALRRITSSTKYPALVKLAEVNPDHNSEHQSSILQPHDLLDSVERNSKLYNALNKLDDNQRQLLSLAYFRGYSHSELASFTDTPIGTVKTHIRRGIEKLKSIMFADGLTGGSDE